MVKINYTFVLSKIFRPLPSSVASITISQMYHIYINMEEERGLKKHHNSYMAFGNQRWVSLSAPVAIKPLW